MRKVLALAALGAGTLGLAGTASATAITGAQDNSENNCTIISLLFGGFDCGYSISAPAISAGAFAGWSGPGFGAGYYTAGSVAAAYVPSVGDGKINPTITGNVVVSGSGGGASISGTFVVGAASRSFATGASTRAVEQWTSITHTLASTAVSSATANGFGGFTYTIGTTPGALCLTSDPSDCFASENGSQTTTGPAGYWNNNVAPLEGPTRSSLRDANPGATTTAVLGGYSCSDTDAGVGCAGAISWSGSESPGWDNLVLVVDTDGAGEVVSGTGWWTQEYLIALGSPAVQADDNSFTASRFTFAGPVIPVPAAVWLFGSALGLLGWVRRRVDR